MFVSVLIVQAKSTEVWSFDRDDISLFVLVFCLLSIDELNWWGVWSVWCVFDVSEIRLFDESVWVSTDFLFPAEIILVKSTPRAVCKLKRALETLKEIVSCYAGFYDFVYFSEFLFVDPWCWTLGMHQIIAFIAAHPVNF